MANFKLWIHISDMKPIALRLRNEDTKRYVYEVKLPDTLHSFKKDKQDKVIIEFAQVFKPWVNKVNIMGAIHAL